MPHGIKLNNSLWILLLLLQIAPNGVAHNIKTYGNVAATFHIEPNHNPKAGEPNKAWFALTRQGGKLIPLAECNCQLKVNLKSHIQERENGKQEIENPKKIIIDPHSLKPLLKPVSADQYQGIPGAEIVFPQAGEYELEFSGTPKAEEDFQPFEFRYNVTVRAGTIAPTVSSSPENVNSPEYKQKMAQSSSQSTFKWQIPVFVLVVVLVLGGIGLVVRRLKIKLF